MSNHIHLIAIPETEGSLAKGIGEADKRYSSLVNFREGWLGYLFQGRFFSCPLHIIAAIRYVLLYVLESSRSPGPIAGQAPNGSSGQRVPDLGGNRRLASSSLS